MKILTILWIMIPIWVLMMKNRFDALGTYLLRNYENLGSRTIQNNMEGTYGRKYNLASLTKQCCLLPVDSRAVEVTTFLNPYSSSGHDQTSLKYQSDATDPTSSMSADLISKFQSHDTISVMKEKADPDDVEMASNHRKRGVAPLEKALGSSASCVCAVPAVVVESLINSTFNRMVANKPDGLRQNEGTYETIEDLEDKPSGDPLGKTISDLNADDDGRSADDGQRLSSNLSTSSMPKTARLGKKASQAALFGEKLVPEHEQT